MTLVEYLAKAAFVWFMGFFPMAEIFVAVPAAFALGLDTGSTIVWSVTGNYVPVLLIHYLYNVLAQTQRVRTWLEKMASRKVKDRLDRYGFWFVLIVTPWAGAWIMAATVKLFGMESRLFLISSFLSLLLYASVLAVLIRMGANLFL